MFSWLKSLFVKNSNETDEQPMEESKESIELEMSPELVSDALIKGMEFAVEHLQMRYEDLAAIVAALLLDRGSSEYVITQDFLDSTLQEGLVVNYQYTKDGHLRVWTELKPDLDLKGDFEVEE